MLMSGLLVCARVWCLKAGMSLKGVFLRSVMGCLERVCGLDMIGNYYDSKNQMVNYKCADVSVNIHNTHCLYKDPFLYQIATVHPIQ